jgi:RNA polymerase sigma-70 factor, ECF subfamily
VMYDLHGMPYEEIAQALEVPLGTVKSRLHRGRVALGRALGAPSGIAGTTGSTVPVQATDPTSEEP